MFCPLASGSSGNSILIKGPDTTVLFDIGISTKEVEKRLYEISISPESIDAICISHEHGDHIRGLDTFVKKYNPPVFCNRETAKVLLRTLKSKPQFKIFQTGVRFFFKEFEILPFQVQHDTVDPVMFAITVGATKIGICTDLGMVSSLIELYLQDMDILYIEANHDENMVLSSSRPNSYKQRVLSRYGHLSNRSCGAFLSSLYHENVQKIFLSHLSEECNDPHLAVETVIQELEKSGATDFQNKIITAHREIITDLILF